MDGLFADPRRLIHMQMALEYQIDSQGYLIPYPGSEEQARFVIYRHAQGFERFFRHDLQEALRSRLIDLDPSLAFEEPSIPASILSLEAPVDGFPVFASGIIPSAQAQPSSVSVVLRQGCWMVEVGSNPVAWAWSVRSNTESAELAVEVDPEFLRLGYGKQVAAAWAGEVQQSGRVAFYSYRMDNLPSQALASSLGVEVFALCKAFD